MKKNLRIMITLGICLFIFCASLTAFSEEIGTAKLQSQIGSIVLRPEEIKEILESLKKFQSQMAELQESMNKLIKEIDLSKVDITPLREEIIGLKSSLESFKQELAKKLEEEGKFIKEELLNKLDFLTTVIRRVTVVFKNIEDLAKESQSLKEQISISTESVRNLSETFQRELNHVKSNQTKIIGLLTVNLLLLSFLVFLQLEKKFRKSTKKGDDMAP